MKTYKIINTTNTVGRRDPKYNTIVDIEYIDNRIKKQNKLNPGDTMFLTVPTLPLSIHRLRIKNLITVEEISEKKLVEILDDAQPKTKKPKAVKKPVVLDKNNNIDEVSTKSSSKKKSSTRSKSSSKSTSSSKSKSSSKSTSSSKSKSSSTSTTESS